MIPQPSKLLYENPFAKPSDIDDFRLEGDACITFPNGRMRMEKAYERDEAKGRHANFILWCLKDFPDDISVSWDFRPLSDAGLAMFWIAASGQQGEDLFSPELKPRNGDYPQYYDGDINALHISYYRENPEEIDFKTCNLRKSRGFHLVRQGTYPLHGLSSAYHIKVIKYGSLFRFSIDDRTIIEWIDDGTIGGPALGGGKIGFRQMAGLVAEYTNLQVHQLTEA